MVKLIFGLIIAGLILYIIYQVRVQNNRFKDIRGACDRLDEINDELDAIIVENDVQDAKEKLHKRSTKLDKRVNKLSEKQESDKE